MGLLGFGHERKALASGRHPVVEVDIQSEGRWVSVVTRLSAAGPASSSSAPAYGMGYQIRGKIRWLQLLVTA